MNEDEIRKENAVYDDEWHEELDVDTDEYAFMFGED